MPHDVKASPQIAVSADLGGLQIGFIEQVEGLSLAEITDRLNIFRTAISRQRAQQALIELLVDLGARQRRLAGLDQELADDLKKIGEEKARTRAAFQAAWDGGGRRTEFRLSDPQRKGLEAFDARLLEKRAELEGVRAQLEHEIPLYKERVAQQEAIIAGRERADVLWMGMPLAEAAE